MYASTFVNMAVASDSTLERRTRCWDLLAEHHFYKWHGWWARWEASTLKNTFKYQNVRTLKLEPNDKKSIEHTIDTPTNTSYSDDKGTQLKGPWILTFTDHMLPDGLIHPFIPPARTYCFTSGNACLTTTGDVSPGQGISQEVFFLKGTARASLFLFYPTGNELSWLQLIREDKQSWPCSSWTEDLAISSSSQLPEGWPSADHVKRAGREKILTVDMEETEGQVLEWAPPEVKEGYRAFFLPDGFLIVCPEVWPQNAPVEVSAYWTVQGSPAIVLLRMYYDSNCRYTKLQEVIYDKI